MNKGLDLVIILFGYLLVMVLVQRSFSFLYVRKIYEQIAHIKKEGYSYINFIKNKLGVKKYFIITFKEDSTIINVYKLSGLFLNAKFVVDENLKNMNLQDVVGAIINNGKYSKAEVDFFVDAISQIQSQLLEKSKQEVV